MPHYNRTRTWQDNSNPFGGGLGPPIAAVPLNEYEQAHQAASDRIDAASARIDNDSLRIDNTTYFLNPRSFGAKGDGRTVIDAAITSGSAVVTSGTAQFAGGDVGKLLIVLPAPGSAEPTFATSVVSVDSATSVTVASAATYTASNLECTFATDDTVALRAWLADPSSGTRYIPDGIFGFSDSLMLGSQYAVWCAPGATLTVMKQIPPPTTLMGWASAARKPPTAIWTSFWEVNKQGVGWQGGTLNCSLLCDDGFTTKYTRGYRVAHLTVRNPMVRNFSFGDPTTQSQSYELQVHAVRGWRDVGVVPVTAAPLASGEEPASVGMYFENYQTDSIVDGGCVMMGAQVGFVTRGGNIFHIGSHSWARAAIGWMDIGFIDSSNGSSYYMNAFSDTPRYIGFRLENGSATFMGCQVLNNALYGTDNQVIGFDFIASNSARMFGCFIMGENSTHRIASDFNPQGLPGYNSARYGNTLRNVVNSWSELPSPRPTNYGNFPAASYSLLFSDIGRRVEVNSATAVTVTVPAARMSNGQSTEFVQMGAGKVSVIAGSGVTVRSPGGLTGSRAQYSTITLTRVSPTETYVLSGDLG